ncbi:MAG: metal ABC transporter permease [Sulfolobales archaeon]
MEVIQSLLLKWLLTITMSSLIYGNLSILISARRLYFLATVTPHSALLAVIIAVIINRIVGVLNEFLWSAIIGCALMFCVGYFIRRGSDTDTITSVYVALTASASVIAMNYILTSFKISYSLWSVILGDPLLIAWSDLPPLLLITVITIFLTALSLKYHVYAGVDPDYVKLVSTRKWLYDYALFFLLGVTSVALIRVTGFILQHILILLPSIVAVKISESSRKAYAAGLITSILAGVLGLQIAILTNSSPSGMIGGIFILIYVISLVISKIRRG